MCVFPLFINIGRRLFHWFARIPQEHTDEPSPKTYRYTHPDIKSYTHSFNYISETITIVVLYFVSHPAVEWNARQKNVRPDVHEREIPLQFLSITARRVWECVGLIFEHCVTQGKMMLLNHTARQTQALQRNGGFALSMWYVYGTNMRAPHIGNLSDFRVAYLTPEYPTLTGCSCISLKWIFEM